MIKITFFIYILIYFLCCYPLKAQEIGYIKKCYDGDTIKVVVNKENINQKRKKYTKIIRVLKIDAFESYESKRTVFQAKKNHMTIEDIIQKGKKATKLCKKDWLHKVVIVDCWKKDIYDRDLCYVKKKETNEDFGEYMIKNKVALPMKQF